MILKHVHYILDKYIRSFFRVTPNIVLLFYCVYIKLYGLSLSSQHSLQVKSQHISVIVYLSYFVMSFFRALNFQGL